MTAQAGRPSGGGLKEGAFAYSWLVSTTWLQMNETSVGRRSMWCCKIRGRDSKRREWDGRRWERGREKQVQQRSVGRSVAAGELPPKLLRVESQVETDRAGCVVQCSCSKQRVDGQAGKAWGGALTSKPPRWTRACPVPLSSTVWGLFPCLSNQQPVTREPRSCSGSGTCKQGRKPSSGSQVATAGMDGMRRGAADCPGGQI